VHVLPVAVSALVAATGQTGVLAAPPQGLPTGPLLAKLSRIAYGFAAVNGDSTPTSARVAVGTRGEVTRLMTTVPRAGRARVPSGPRVYVIRMRGRFTAYAFPTPLGFGEARGVALTLVLATSNYRLLDWMLQKRGYVSDLTPLDVSEPLPRPH
jgi:hypothetical protein